MRHHVAMGDWAAVFDLARRQFGALHVEDVRSLGISRSTLAARANRERWRRPYRAVFVVPGSPDSYELKVSAALLALGQPCWASHRTAGWLLGVLDPPPARVELVVPQFRRLAAPTGVVLHRSRTLPSHHVTVARGLPTTNVARTIVDLAGIMDGEDLRQAVIDGLQRKRVSLDQIQQVRREIARVRRGNTLARVLDELDEERCDSRLEWRVRRLLRRAGLRPHPEPFAFRCPDGVVIHLDIAFPEHWVAIECDGYGFHSSRTAFATDRVRWGQALQGGWRLMWVDWSRLADPDGIVREVRANIRSADPALPPAQSAR